MSRQALGFARHGTPGDCSRGPRVGGFRSENNSTYPEILLKNVCERSALLSEGEVIEADALPLEVRLGRPTAADEGPVPTLKEMERELVLRALDATGGNRTRAAKLLGITYPTLKKKIDHLTP